MAEPNHATADAAQHVEHPLPEPTYWPWAMAGGITLLAAGFATNLMVSLTGLALLVVAAWGWARDLLLEHSTTQLPPTERSPEEGVHVD